jgi:hypothetical protein
MKSKGTVFFIERCAGVPRRVIGEFTEIVHVFAQSKVVILAFMMIAHTKIPLSPTINFVRERISADILKDNMNTSGIFGENIPGSSR